MHLFFGGRFQLYFMKIIQKTRLITNGLYAFARHPIYLGGIILLLSVSLF
ncbi:MAG: isoprenylcysteine carboxylmethyltransferase family protein [Candidatus Hodarchaeales archaeon]